MLLWKDLKSIYDQYHAQKGMHRKLFGTSSPFIYFLENFIKDKPLDTPLLLSEEAELLNEITEISADHQLSYQLAQSLVSRCIKDETGTLFNFLKIVHSFHLLNEPLYQLIKAHPNPILIAQEFLSVSENNNLLVEQSLNNLSKGTITLECSLGYLFLDIENKEKAIFWFKEALKKNQFINLNNFSENSHSADVLHFIAQQYEQGKITTQNSSLALLFYKKAAKFNQQQSLFCLGERSNDKKESFIYYMSAGQNSSQAKVMIENFTQNQFLFWNSNHYNHTSFYWDIRDKELRTTFLEGN